MRLNKHKISGFSLVELSIVIVIISVLTGMIIFTIQSRMDSVKLYVTKERMQVIEEALEKYVEQYGHVPCPSRLGLDKTANGYGKPEVLNTVSNPSTCDNLQALGTGLVKGNVPFHALGLDAQTGVDGWGNRFDYVIIKAFADPKYYLDDTVTFVNSFQIGSKTTSPFVSDTKEVTFLLLSHGVNSYGAYRDKDGQKVDDSVTGTVSTNDVENSNNNNIFIQSNIEKDQDDILIFKTRDELPVYINKITDVIDEVEKN